MTTVEVALERKPYEVVIGPGVLNRIGPFLADRPRVAVVSQAGIVEHWGDRLMSSLDEAGVDAELFLVDEGEDAKSLSTVESLCRRFARWGLLRADVVVALGGGVVGDTAGFAAASYHRGVDLVQAPTSLLAMVDSGIGGKTGVNIPEGKNLVGAFHQPVGVFCDIDVLATLDEREYRSGLGEVLKYACVLDVRLQRMIRDHVETLLARDPGMLEELVERSVAIKAEVVAADEHELTGVRSRLNYGHTLAHALETLGGYDLFHGEAVAIGVVYAAELARLLDRIGDDAVMLHRELVTALGLPASVPAPLAKRITIDDVVDQMRRDKKAAGGLTFVLAGPDGLDRVEDPSERAVVDALRTVGLGRS